MKKLILLSIAIVFSVMIKAQDSIAFNFTFNHMALSVKDVKASVDFYTKVFQVKEITNRSAIEGIRWLSLGEGKELHLISVIKQNVTINKAVHLAFTTKQFDAFVNRLQELKIEFSDWPGKPNTVNTRADGVKQIYFKDPDDYWIEINNGYAAAPPVEKIKDEVWQLEENYWKYVKASDLISYATLWDDNFIGYPSNNIIGNKAHISEWITDMYKDHKGKTYNYELTRKIENVFGDIVIVLYDVTHVWTSDKNNAPEKSTFKITHTWKKTDKGWLIIGGMGAKK
jgi:catechol 2,3-dioxygenase-like lactoylglutathione lyase family enzyme/ketosteroid isomerase-like protein